MVLNGAEGVQDALAQIIATGGSAMSVAKQFLSGVAARPTPDPAARPARGSGGTARG